MTGHDSGVWGSSVQLSTSNCRLVAQRLPLLCCRLLSYHTRVHTPRAVWSASPLPWVCPHAQQTAPCHTAHHTPVHQHSSCPAAGTQHDKHHSSRQHTYAQPAGRVDPVSETRKVSSPCAHMLLLSCQKCCCHQDTAATGPGEQHSRPRRTTQQAVPLELASADSRAASPCCCRLTHLECCCCQQLWLCE